MGVRSILSTLFAVVAGFAAAACQSELSESAVEEPTVEEGSGADSTQSVLGSGFVVWESNRSGNWRLWRRDLDGTARLQVTPDEGDRLHCCPHISPDGRWIAYLSLAADQQGYPPGGAQGALRLIRPDGTGDRLLLPEARNYYENRAVVWRSPDELIFIDSDRRTALLSLDSGEVETLTRQASESFPWLIDSRLRYATSGRVSFAPFDKVRREIDERSPVGGCQPYFSHDGRWGFWVAAPGGPIHQIELETGAVETLLKKSDPRLPGDFGYLYFPMLSADGRALAFAASRNEHPHFKADYEIFVAPTNPTTLKLLDSPIRITDHPGTDRYPDIYLEPLELGLFKGEAPLRVHVDPPGEPRRYRWSWGDGATAEGTTGEHTFDRPGFFGISATAGDVELTGRALVEPPKPPHVTKVQVSQSGSAVTLRFDEPVDVEDATWTLESGALIKSFEQIDDGRGLVLKLDRPVITLDRLVVTGIRDTASLPNIMAETSLELLAANWPVDRTGLVMLWETGSSANLVLDEDRGVEESVILRAHGPARLDHNWALLPSGGRFTASKEIANRLRWACQATNELTVEAVVRPQPTVRKRGVILAAAQGKQNFVLSQQADTLLMSIRVKSRGPDASPEVRMMELPPGVESHVAVTYSPGRLVAYLNGEEAFSTDEIQGGFFHWQTFPVTIGSDARGRSTWHGVLEGLAIYDRVLSGEEIRESAARQLRRVDARDEVPQWTLRVEKIDCSAVPTLEEITPYREALATCEYHVVETLEGQYDRPLARVAQWVIQDGQKALPRRAAGGEVGQVVVERFQDNPQLDSLYLSDTLPDAPDLPLFYLVGESRRP
jgi:hypothetical protein